MCVGVCVCVCSSPLKQYHQDQKTEAELLPPNPWFWTEPTVEMSEVLFPPNGAAAAATLVLAEDVAGINLRIKYTA